MYYTLRILRQRGEAGNEDRLSLTVTVLPPEKMKSSAFIDSIALDGGFNTYFGSSNLYENFSHWKKFVWSLNEDRGWEKEMIPRTVCFCCTELRPLYEFSTDRAYKMLVELRYLTSNMCFHGQTWLGDTITFLTYVLEKNTSKLEKPKRISSTFRPILDNLHEQIVPPGIAAEQRVIAAQLEDDAKHYNQTAVPMIIKRLIKLCRKVSEIKMSNLEEFFSGELEGITFISPALGTVKVMKGDDPDDPDSHPSLISPSEDDYDDLSARVAKEIMEEVKISVEEDGSIEKRAIKKAAERWTREEKKRAESDKKLQELSEAQARMSAAGSGPQQGDGASVGERVATEVGKTVAKEVVRSLVPF